MHTDRQRALSGIRAPAASDDVTANYRSLCRSTSFRCSIYLGDAQFFLLQFPSQIQLKAVLQYHNLLLRRREFLSLRAPAMQ